MRMGHYHSRNGNRPNHKLLKGSSDPFFVGISLHPLQLETPSPTVDGYRPIGWEIQDFIFLSYSKFLYLYYNQLKEYQMKNLSLEGLTPEQIKLLESVADGFRVAKKEEPVVVESPKDEPPKFYRIISMKSWLEEEDDYGYTTEIDFIAKVRSNDPDSLERVLDDMYFQYLKKHVDKNKEKEGFDLIRLISEYDFFEDANYSKDGFSRGIGFTIYVDEITEEEYNDSDKWKDADVECIPAKFNIVSSGFTKILKEY